MCVCLSISHCHLTVGSGYLSTEKQEEEAQERAKECEFELAPHTAAITSSR